MTDDATLSDFFGADDGDDESGPESGADGPAAAAPDVEPARSTYAWGEYTCENCGGATRRAWRDGDALVCPSCKTW
ncbi:DUF7573 domain-containing protein [Salinilacihabitans rarus]|uniref:DUF7573 domain-containing protein n=1 Tax=Salinilacihabitans rarus TaxID=2961596 RepID=UPI0020C8DD3C|nr:hypothetical protein [Salinilacihabitans rarus]